jgi:uncharacterized membrane protein YfhO
MLKQVRANNPTLAESFKKFFDGLAADRRSLMMGSILRSFAFIAAAALLLFLLIRDKIKPVVAIIGIILLSFIDLIAVDAKYLNSDNYQDKDENEANFKKNSMDDAILADKSFFRVFNIAGNAFSGGDNFTSYYYNSVGGYHPAKLRLYLDLIDKRLNKEGEEIFQALQTNPDSISKVKTQSLNMLNAKYFIYKDNTGETKAQWKNVNALGNCWFVNQLLFVNNPNEEMKALDSIDPKITAVVNKDFKKDISFIPQPDSSAKIQLVKNDNDKITYTSESATNQFAVFSEVYYKAGWRAFVDGKEYPIIKTDYVLRGLALPAGKHNIEFRFEPQGYMKGKSLTLISSIILAILVLVAIYMERRKNKMRTANA